MNSDLEIRKTRITEQELPRELWIQEGEIFNIPAPSAGASTDPIPCARWGEWRKEWVRWEEEANPNDQPGIAVSGGGWGYAGWDPETHIYTRYPTPLRDNEHCLQVGIPSLIGELLTESDANIETLCNDLVGEIRGNEKLARILLKEIKKSHPMLLIPDLTGELGYLKE